MIIAGQLSHGLRRGRVKFPVCQVCGEIFRPCVIVKAELTEDQGCCNDSCNGN